LPCRRFLLLRHSASWLAVEAQASVPRLTPAQFSSLSTHWSWDSPPSASAGPIPTCRAAGAAAPWPTVAGKVPQGPSRFGELGRLTSLKYQPQLRLLSTTAVPLPGPTGLHRRSAAWVPSEPTGISPRG
ncbi:hypothetical protein B0I37DRAFT_443718, partial [Chaetomium sp. MPI-CAGE-AT-0009]